MTVEKWENKEKAWNPTERKTGKDLNRRFRKEELGRLRVTV